MAFPFRKGRGKEKENQLRGRNVPEKREMPTIADEKENVREDARNKEERATWDEGFRRFEKRRRKRGDRIEG